MTSKTAAILVRESKGLLVTRQQPGPIPSHLLSTTGEFDCVMAAIRLGGGGGGRPVEQQADTAGKAVKVHNKQNSGFDSWQL